MNNTHKFFKRAFDTLIKNDLTYFTFSGNIDQLLITIQYKDYDDGENVDEFIKNIKLQNKIYQVKEEIGCYKQDEEMLGNDQGDVLLLDKSCVIRFYMV